MPPESLDQNIVPPPISTPQDNPPVSKRLPLWLPVVIILLLIAGGAAAYVTVFQPNLLRQFVSQTPSLQTVESNLANNLLDNQIKSANYQLNIVSDFREVPNGATSHAEIQITSSVDQNNADDPRSQGQVRANVSISNNNASQNYGMNLQTIVANKTIYLKLDSLDLGFLGALFRVPMNQWVAITPKEIISQAATQTSLEIEGLSKRALEIIKKHRPIRLGELIDEPTLDGVQTYHHPLILDKVAIKQVAREFRKLELGKSTPSTLSEADEAELATFEQQIDKFSLPTGEIWIGQQDFLPYQIKFDWPITPSETTNNWTGQINVTLRASHFNEPVSISVPYGAKTLQEVLTEMGIPSSPPVMPPPLPNLTN